MAVRGLLLDACAYIEMAAGDQRVADALSAATEVYFSAISLGELLVGFPPDSHWESKRGTLERFLTTTGVQVLPVGEETAMAYASLFNHVKQRGRMIPQNDLWIAACALEHDLTLLTTDRHFADLPIACCLLE